MPEGYLARAIERVEALIADIDASHGGPLLTDLYLTDALREALVALQAERDTQHTRNAQIAGHAEAIRNYEYGIALEGADTANVTNARAILTLVAASKKPESQHKAGSHGLPEGKLEPYQEIDPELALLGEPEPDTTLCACPMCPDPRHGEPETDTTKEAAT